MSNPYKLKVGDVVYTKALDTRQDQGKLVRRTVSRIGRKFGYLVTEPTSWEVQFDLATMRYGLHGAGYGYTGDVYLNVEQYEEARNKGIAWANLQNKVRNARLHELVTSSMVLEASRLLGFRAEEILPPQPPYKEST